MEEASDSRSPDRRDRIVALLGGRSMVIALIVASAFFMENLDATIIVTALPKMAQSFAITPARMSLGVTAYMLAVAALIPASGWLADRIGTRTLFFSAIGFFTLASMLCGIAPNFPTFIAARIVQGAAAAMMSPVGRLVVLRNTQKSELMRALSTLVWPALIAPVLGPPLGGFITDAANWRWIFYVNLPLGLMGMALVLGFIPNEKAAEPTPFDIKGFLLMALALGCLTYGIDLIGSLRPASLGVGSGLLALAVLIGWRAYLHAGATPRPVVSLDALRVKSFFVSNITGGNISRAAVSATPFLLALMFQLGLGMSAAVSGLLLLIYMAANLALKTVTTPIMRRFGIRNVLVVNSLLASVAIAACALISPASPLALNALILAFAGASRSMQLTAITTITFADIAPDQRAPATVLFSLTMQVFMGMGVAVGALMLNFSQILRGAPVLGLFDFRLALVLTGLFSALAVFPYASLPHGAGAEISGTK